MKIKLGQTVSDRISGFTGVVTGLVSYISGCSQALIQPRVKPDDGAMVSSQWIDVDRVIVDLGAPVITIAISAPGRDREAPKR